MKYYGSWFVESDDKLSVAVTGDGYPYTLRVGAASIHFDETRAEDLQAFAESILAVFRPVPEAPEMEFAPEYAEPAGEEHAS